MLSHLFSINPLLTFAASVLLRQIRLSVLIVFTLDHALNLRRQFELAVMHHDRGQVLELDFAILLDDVEGTPVQAAVRLRVLGRRGVRVEFGVRGMDDGVSLVFDRVDFRFASLHQQVLEEVDVD